MKRSRRMRSRTTLPPLYPARKVSIAEIDREMAAKRQYLKNPAIGQQFNSNTFRTQKQAREALMSYTTQASYDGDPMVYRIKKVRVYKWLSKKPKYEYEAVLR